MQRIVRFLLVGGAATLLQYVLLIIGVQLGLGPVSLVSGAAFLMSAVFNFFASRSFTFGSDAPVGPASLRFMAMVASGAALNTAVMEAMVRASQHYLVSQLVATAIVLIWNYLVSSRWVFAEVSSSISAEQSESL